jgi:hypothetical protein
LRVIEGYGALPAFGLLNQLQVGDTGPAESTRQGNLQRVGLLFLGSRDSPSFFSPFSSPLSSSIIYLSLHLSCSPLFPAMSSSLILSQLFLSCLILGMPSHVSFFFLICSIKPFLSPRLPSPHIPPSPVFSRHIISPSISHSPILSSHFLSLSLLSILLLSFSPRVLPSHILHPLLLYILHPYKDSVTRFFASFFSVIIFPQDPENNITVI